MIEFAIFLCRVAQQWGCDGNEIWRKGSLQGEDDARMSNTCIAGTCAEKPCDTRVDNEK